MLTKRIIPCLDVKNGQVVKGTSFADLKYAGNPVKLARDYYEQGADELVFLDITASYEKRKTMIGLVEKVAKGIFIPFTVGGGINSAGDIRSLLKAGADKISINTAAIKNPNLIKEASKIFGSQCIVVAIDAKKVNSGYEVFINGGRTKTGLDAVKWARKVENLGAGEILLTSMDNDGTKEGYDLELTRKISRSVNIPVIASGGAGTLSSMAKVLKYGKADAALAASIFHYKKYSISRVKKYLKRNGVRVRT
ncbi:MAG TPA: imidazole glycerol phosphate synthase subunit HisF [Candidatus Nanoarchaeia archaeon]|nr:imidazole glycerol phosphate synthase subunit HisF [Candidatus Nanoarchaeia archaeon]